jgi:hypothetical protein
MSLSKTVLVSILHPDTPSLQVKYERKAHTISWVSFHTETITGWKFEFTVPAEEEV